MSLKAEYLQSLYKTERIIKHSKYVTVELVRNSQTGDLCIKKTLADRSLGKVYQVIKDIDHDHIVNVLDIFEFETEFVVIEEYIQGKSLSEFIKAPLDENLVLNWIIQICEALKFLHNQSPSIIHRDLKPSNIMLQLGHIILIDFDIARSVKNDANQDTRHIGTTGYAAPEQYGFAQTDQRSDIYALGILFKECLQGKTSKWEPIIKKCTAIDPVNRYQSVEEFLSAINKKKSHISKRVQIFVSIVSALMIMFALGIAYRTLIPNLNPVISTNSPASSTTDIANSSIISEQQNDKTLIQSENGNRNDLIPEKKESVEAEMFTKTTADSISFRERDAFLDIHNVIYPQFEEVSNLNAKVELIFRNVQANIISPETGARQILDLRNRIRNMSAVMSSDKVISGGKATSPLISIITKWTYLLDSYVDVLENKYRVLLEGRYDNPKVTGNELTSIMNDYNQVQQKFNLP